jgi:integrase
MPRNLKKNPLPQFDFLSPDWQKCIDSWLTYSFEKSGSLSTYEHYRHDITALLTRYRKSPELLSRENIEEALASPGTQFGRVGAPIKFGTKNNRLCCYRALFKFASEWPVLENGIPQPLLRRLSPCAGIRFGQRERPGYRTLDDQALTAFFSCIDRESVTGARDYSLFITYYVTCQRRQVLCDLRWGDIQEATFIENGAMRRGHTYSWLGKGRGRILESAELPALCYSAIIRWLEVSDRLATIAAGDPVWCACPGYHGQAKYDSHRPLSSQTVWKISKRYAAKASLDLSAVSPHAFRHSGAQGRLLAGQSIFEISQHLHHKSLDVTSVYLRELVSPQDRAPASMVAKFAAL